MNLLLDYLDKPQEELDIIHIAGTNGKGSTSAILTAIYKVAGYQVGTYNSPEIVKFNERMRINDNYISDDSLAQLVQEIKPAIKKVEDKLAHPTFFEVVTAIAILYFAQENVDLAILEVGLGGELDATNVGNSLVSVITNVSLDHTKYLGDTVEEIAREKGGIIKPGQSVITAAIKPDVIAVLRELAEHRNAELININEEFSWQQEDSNLARQKFSVVGAKRDYKHLKLSLLGQYQIINTVTSLAVVETLNNDYPVNKTEIKQGLTKVEWPGRLEVVATNPTIILDGAHNQVGAEMLNYELESLDYNNLIIVVSILADKDYSSIIEQLATHADQLILSKNNNQRAAQVEELERQALKYNLDLIIEEELELAVDYAVENANKEDLILIGGSLYTVAQIRARFV
jgi:dihydrofolate synthase/folylpolyglutamate synthase